MWASDTPSREWGPGSSQKASPSGMPASAVAATSGQDHAPSR